MKRDVIIGIPMLIRRRTEITCAGIGTPNKRGDSVSFSSYVIVPSKTEKNVNEIMRALKICIRMYCILALKLSRRNNFQAGKISPKVNPLVYAL